MRRAARVALLTEIPAPFRVPLFNELAASEGVRLRVLFLADRDPKRQYRIYDEESRFDRRTLRGRSVLRRGRWLVVNAGTLRELVRFDPDVVVVGGWNQPAFWQAYAYARIRRRPLVTWVESTARDLRPNGVLLERAKRILVGASAAVVVPGRASAEYVELLGVPPSRVVVAPNAVDQQVFGERVATARQERDALRRRLDLDGCVFLYVGRFDPEKGVDVLVRAFADVPGTLVLIGGGAAEARLRADTPPRTRVIGRLERDQLVDWYAAADVFVLPSLSEQWGMVLNEAAAAGLPLVATDAAGAAHDLIEPGENGLRVPPGDVGALAGALRRLEADPEFRQVAGRRSRERAAGHTPAAWARRLATTVAELLD